jgi:predicted Zn-dependent protease
MIDRDTELVAAIAMRESGRAQEALPVLVTLSREYPDDAIIQYQTAWAHDLLGLESAAVPYYERALALGIGDPDREGVVLGLGSTYRNVGRQGDAVALLEQGVSDYPENAAMRCFLALAHLNAGAPDTSVATLLSVVLDTCPSPSIDRYRRALAWYRDDLLGLAEPEG